MKLDEIYSMLFLMVIFSSFGVILGQSNTGSNTIQLLNITCAKDIDCIKVHFAAKCFQNSSCYCEVEKGFFRGKANTCVYHSKVSETCDITGNSSICIDSNSKCTLEQQFTTGVGRCLCKTGTILVRYNNTTKCAYPISALDDISCTECDVRGGACFSLQPNKKRDGCACPNSFSGTNCQTVHVNVSCSTNEMKICYEPHAIVNVSRGLWMYSEGRANQISCRARLNPNQCGGAGRYSLNLPLSEGFLSTCGTQLIWEGNKMKYTNTIRVQLNPSKTSYDDIMFTTFCSFVRVHDVTFFGVRVNSYGNGEVGQDIKPVLALGIKDQLGQYLRKGIYYREGDIVHLNIFLNTNNGYGALRVEDCTLSSSVFMPDVNAVTLPIIINGCPAPNQHFINDKNNFRKVMNKSNEFETGMMQLYRLKGSSTLHVHCRVKLCVKIYPQGCIPHTCSINERKRRNIERPEDVTFITLSGEIPFATLSTDDAILGMSVSAIAFSIIIFIFIIIITVYIARQTKKLMHRHRRKSRKKVTLINTRQLFIKTYSQRDLPSHMTESRI